MTSRWSASRALSFTAGDIGVGGPLFVLSLSVDGPVTILASGNNHLRIMWRIKERQSRRTTQDQVLHYVAIVLEMGLSYGCHHLLLPLVFHLLLELLFMLSSCLPFFVASKPCLRRPYEDILCECSALGVTKETMYCRR